MVQRLAGAPSFELIKGKLLRPLVQPGTIRRPALIERLADSDSRSVVSVVAPAGYGKTTLVAQWPERDGQAIAWVSVDEGDNDPKVLLAYIAEALDEVEPVGGRVFDALASPASSVPGSVVPRLCSAFSSMISPIVLVLDDVHLLHNSECRAALSVLADHVPDGSRTSGKMSSSPFSMPSKITRASQCDGVAAPGRAVSAATVRNCGRVRLPGFKDCLRRQLASKSRREVGVSSSGPGDDPCRPRNPGISRRGSGNPLDR